MRKQENVTYIQTADQSAGRQSPDATDTFWTSIADQSADDRSIGRILVDSGKLTVEQAEQVAALQREEGMYFGEAAKKLKLVTESDIQHALSKQFNYPYLKVTEGIFSDELIAAYHPFSSQAEALRGIRSQILMNLPRDVCSTIAVVGSNPREGRSYLAANLAVLFGQMGKRTLLVDADLRHPRQHELFKFNSRVGLSAMLAGRVKKEDLEHLPESIPFFTHLSVLGAGAVPPNPLELLAGDRLPRILRELSIYYDIILIDTPAARSQSDVQPVAICAGNALLVTRKNHTRFSDTQRLVNMLQNAQVKIVGSILNDY